MCTQIVGVQMEIDKLNSIVNNIAVYKKYHLAKDHESKISKAEKLDMMIVEGDKAFKNAGTSIKQEAMYWYLRGTMNNCSPNHMQIGMDALRRAIEIDPKFVDAWNQLGECYWSRMELDLAKQCFESALQKSVNKFSLRNLSVLIRKQSHKMKPDDKINSLNDALCHAKRALDLDLTDGESWSILGNSYLALFFNSPLQKQHILQAIACYGQAEKNLLDTAERTDVFFHKAVAYKHIENYSSALENLSKCLGNDPDWDNPSKTYDSLIRYLEKIKSSIGNKGKLKPKKFNTMLKDLESQLRRFSVNPRYAISNIGNLKSGKNMGVITYGKVLWVINVDTYTKCTLPVTFGVVDAKGDEIVVTLFNSNSCHSFFKIGDNVAVLEPQYEVVDLIHEQKEYKFRKVRIDNPATLLVNDKFFPLEFYGDYSFETSPN